MLQETSAPMNASKCKGVRAQQHARKLKNIEPFEGRGVTYCVKVEVGGGIARTALAHHFVAAK
jgi:putative methionine-R-sulfoxide reductase with GAF domain